MSYDTKTSDNLIDRYNYILYDTALKAYVLVSLSLGVIYALSLLIAQGENGNILAKIGTWLAVPIIAVGLNYRDFKELFTALRKKSRGTKSNI